MTEKRDSLSYSRREFLRTVLSTGAVAAGFSSLPAIASWASHKQEITDFCVRPPYGEFLRGFSRIQMPEDHRHTLMKGFFRQMDSAGIAKGVVMGRTTTAPGINRLIIPNSDIIELTKDFPDKLSGFGSLNLEEDRDNALREIALCSQGGLSGITFECPANKTPMRYDDNLLLMAYECCAKYGLMVTLNCNSNIGPDSSFSDLEVVSRVAGMFPDMIFLVHCGGARIVNAINEEVVWQLVYDHSNVYLLPDIFMHREYISPRLGTPLGEALLRKTLFASSYPSVGLQAAAYRIRAIYSSGLPYESLVQI